MAKTDESKEDVKTDEKTEEEIDEKEGFWRKVRVRWVLDEEESQASRYDGGKIRASTCSVQS